MSQIVIVHPSGPSSQCRRCSGVVHASNTTARGASNTRVMTISRSDGVVNVVRPTLFALTMIALLVLHLLKVGIQPFITRIPKPSEMPGVLGNLLERRRLHPTR